jgi:hypothetical protein
MKAKEAAEMKFKAETEQKMREEMSRAEAQMNALKKEKEQADMKVAEAKEKA